MKWRSESATPTERTGPRRRNFSRGWPARSICRSPSPATRSPRERDGAGRLRRRRDRSGSAGGRDGARQAESARSGARPDDPQGCDHQCRARAAARGPVLDGDHSIADAPRLPHRPGVRIRARSRATRDFIATLGVGLTSQYLEQFGRKLLGGLLGSLGGGLGRTLGRQTASSGLTFATTYALGRVAQRYYAGGRQLDTAALKATFTEMLAEARGLAPRYRAEIEQRANSINPRELASLIRGV